MSGYPSTVHTQQPGYAGPQPGYGGPQQPGYGGPPQPGYGGPQQAGYGQPTGGYGNPAGPVVNQPDGQGQQGWMQAPQGPQAAAGCPPGLEVISRVDHILIKQQIELIEAFAGYETNNKYVVLGPSGQKIFLAAEDTCCCTRSCCGSGRPFTINLMDNLGRQVMQLESPCRCDCCCCCCCLKEVEVQAPPGRIIGKVEQEWSLCKPRFRICDESGEVVLRIEGPCLPECEMCGERIFQVYTRDGQTPCGQITKKFSGLAKEVFTDSDNFGITFPMDLSVTTKATVMAATFLIDFMFFESVSNND